MSRQDWVNIHMWKEESHLGLDFWESMVSTMEGEVVKSERKAFYESELPRTLLDEKRPSDLDSPDLSLITTRLSYVPLIIDYIEPREREAWFVQKLKDAVCNHSVKNLVAECTSATEIFLKYHESGENLVAKRHYVYKQRLTK